jgi:hypothetical protein
LLYKIFAKSSACLFIRFVKLGINIVNLVKVNLLVPELTRQDSGICFEGITEIACV